jgi:hypothetical protein
LSIAVQKDLKITLTKGDYGLIRLSILQDGQASPFATGDVIRFIVKEFPTAAVTLIQKQVTLFADGVAEIEIESADTQDLKLKTYIYGIQWIDQLGNVRTIVPGAEHPNDYPQFEVVAGL